MATHELNEQHAAKIKVQAARQSKNERDALDLKKTAAPSTAPQLRMTNQILQAKQRREMLLEYSKNWRATHTLTPFPMTFSMRHDTSIDAEKERKLLAIAKAMHQRQQAKIQHQKQAAAEKAYEQIHTHNPEFSM